MGNNGTMKSIDETITSFRCEVKDIRLLKGLAKKSGKTNSYWIREGIKLVLKEQGMIDENGIKIRNY